MDKKQKIRYTVWVRFFNKDSLSKEYAFYIDEGDSIFNNNSPNLFFLTKKDGVEYYNKFTITNQKDYNYANYVVFTKWYSGDYYKEKNITPERQINSIKTITYWGTTGLRFTLGLKGDSSVKFEELRKVTFDSLTTEIKLNSATAAEAITAATESTGTLAWTKYQDYTISDKTIPNESSIYTNGTIYINNDEVAVKEDVNKLTQNMGYINSTLEKLEERVINMENKGKEKNSIMATLLKDVNFGKASKVKMSIYGPAFTGSDGAQLAWSTKDKKWVDVTGLTFDEEFAFMMPVAKSDVVEGDFILHNNMWVRVLEISEDGKVTVEKPFEKEVAVVLPTTNMFGFNYYTKLVYFGLDTFSATATKDNPFGNLLPFLLMKNGLDDDALPLIMMMNQNEKHLDFKNPMMMYFLMKDKENSMLPLMMCMNSK